jgi:hypothetical protein
MSTRNVEERAGLTVKEFDEELDDYGWIVVGAG